jgi:hypothetical protein
MGRWMMLAGMVTVLAATSGCSMFHHGSPKCREPALSPGLVNGPALALPPGRDAPDARGAVRIPELNEPEQPRSAKDPCLSTPPDYKISQP